MEYAQKARTILGELTTVQSRLKRISETIENELPGWMGSSEDADNRFLIYQLKHMNDVYLEDLLIRLDYLQRPVLGEGVLTRSATGRYALGERELSSGSPLELYIYDADEECYDWHTTRLEHAKKYGGYYAYHYPEFELEGAKARIR